MDGINEDTPPMKRLNSGACTQEDYLFVHTDSHKEFMELLLEKRKRLETTISNKLREKGRQAGEGIKCLCGST